MTLEQTRAAFREEEPEDEPLASAERQVGRFLDAPGPELEANALAAIRSLGEERSDARADYLLLLIDPAQGLPAALQRAATEALVQMRHRYAIGLHAGVPEAERPKGGGRRRRRLAVLLNAPVFAASLMWQFVMFSERAAPWWQSVLASPLSRGMLLLHGAWALGLGTLLLSRRRLAALLGQLLLVLPSGALIAMYAMLGEGWPAALGAGLTFVAWAISTSRPDPDGA